MVGINDPAAIEVAEFWQGLVDREEITITPRYDAGIYPQFNDGKILSSGRRLVELRVLPRERS